MLGGAGDSGRDVDVRLHDLAGLADLHRVGHPAGVDDGSRSASRSLEHLGEVVDHGELVGLAEAAASGDDHFGFVELGSGRLLDVNGSDGGPTGRSEVGHRGSHHLGRSATGRFSGERLGAERGEEGALAREGGGDERVATEDRGDHGDRVAIGGDVGVVGDHGAIKLDRETGHHVPALVVLREHDQVGAVAALDNRDESGGDGRSGEGSTEVAGGVHPGGAELAEGAGDGGGVTADHRGHGPTEGARLREQFERSGGDRSVIGLGEHPDVRDRHVVLRPFPVSFRRSRVPLK